MTSFCKTYVPKDVQEKVESLKDDDAGLKEFGVQMAVAMCQKIMAAKVSPGVPPAHLPSIHTQSCSMLLLCACRHSYSGACYYAVQSN